MFLYIASKSVGNVSLPYLTINNWEDVSLPYNQQLGRCFLTLQVTSEKVFP